MLRIAFATLCLTASLIGPAKAMSEEEAATRFIAISAFVRTDCPGMKINTTLLKGVMAHLAINPEALVAKPGRAAQGEMMIAAFRADKQNSCTKAWELFGDNGTIMSGLIER